MILDYFTQNMVLIASILWYLMAYRMKQKTDAKYNDAISFWRSATKKLQEATKVHYETMGMLKEIEKHQERMDAKGEEPPQIIFHEIPPHRIKDEIPDEVIDAITSFYENFYRKTNGKPSDEDVLNAVREMPYDELLELLDLGTIEEVKRVRRIFSEINEHEKVSMIDGYLANRLKK